MAGEKLYFLRSESSGSVPASLGEGEFAINLTDGVIYSADSSGTVKAIANVAKWGRIVGNIDDQPDLANKLAIPTILLTNGKNNTQTITGTASRIVYPVIKQNAADTTYSVNAQWDTVTVNETATYRIYYKVGFSNIDSTRKSTKVTLTAGGTAVDHIYSYNRNKTDGKTSVAGEFVVDLQSGDTIFVKARTIGGGGTLETIDDTCTLLIERMNNVIY